MEDTKKRKSSKDSWINTHMNLQRLTQHIWGWQQKRFQELKGEIDTYPHPNSEDIRKLYPLINDYSIFLKGVLLRKRNLSFR